MGVEETNVESRRGQKRHRVVHEKALEGKVLPF